ncbi:MAG: cyclic nucleotide-binding domain-containing protein [Aquamicrobium sp.]|uniref:Crp/Fnr family transcriptional regulator n=1 Tax=Aquamicrobium sp. TaxID=1872579 RepID=UPI00349E5D72|nr:cyclic nucleotide-binding domain-containing protein [Aquamicrobium sp.]
MGELRIDQYDREVVRGAPMFSALPPDAIDSLLAQSELQFHQRRTTLFEQDEPASAFYLVLDGWVKLFRMTVSGDEAVVGVFARGDCIAEVPCLTGGHYPVSAEVVADARLIAIPARGIVELTRASPEIGLAMLASTSLHLRKLVDQIEELKARTGPQRLANFLVELAPVKQGPCTIALPYEKLLIAGRLGMKPESLSRAFQRLQSVGVRINQSTIAVSDVARLAEFAGRERLLAFRCPGFRVGCAPG